MPQLGCLCLAVAELVDYVTPALAQHSSTVTSLASLVVERGGRSSGDPASYGSRSELSMGSTVPTIVAASDTMCVHAFDILCGQLDMNTSSAEKGVLSSIPDTGDVGVFVTWNKRQGDRWLLRGCIGTLSPSDLRQSISTYALHSAFRDSRFDSITASEVSSLQVVVSVLSGFDTAPGGVYDWTIGVHGIVLEIPYHGRSLSATYLPEVCAEQGWTKEECIESLSRKAGFRGQLTEDRLATCTLRRYVSTKASMSYEEYLQWQAQ